MAAAIDFTNRDYLSIREDMLNRAAVVLPEWASRDASDFGMLLVELFAYADDVLHYYTDRSANEAFLSTAARRASVLRIAQMLDYRPTPRSPASVTLTFTKASSEAGNPVTVPKGTLVGTSESAGDKAIYFETDTDMTISGGASTNTVTAHEGLSVTEELLGVSRGLEWQELMLKFIGVYEDSVRFFVYEGPPGIDGEPTAVEWRRVDRLIEADSTQGVFSVYTNEDGTSSIQLGDGVHGRIPAANTKLTAAYRYGYGSLSNVAAGSISTIVTAIPGIVSVHNAAAASGGVDAESIESMRVSIPRSVGAQDRGVTVQDHAQLAQRVVGVTKASAAWGGDVGGDDQEVVVTVAPATATAPSTALKDEVESYLSERTLAGFVITVQDPTYVGINITATVTVRDEYVQNWVLADVTAAIDSMLAFDSQTFGAKLRLGDLYRTVYEIAGVDTISISVFSATTGVGDIQLAWDEIAVPGTIALTPSGGIVGP